MKQPELLIIECFVAINDDVEIRRKYCAAEANEYLEAIHFSLAGCKQSTIANQQSRWRLGKPLD
jgi:hypothetical protein